MLSHKFLVSKRLPNNIALKTNWSVKSSKKSNTSSHLTANTSNMIFGIFSGLKKICSCHRKFHHFPTAQFLFSDYEPSSYILNYLAFFFFTCTDVTWILFFFFYYYFFYIHIASSKFIIKQSKPTIIEIAHLILESKWYNKVELRLKATVHGWVGKQKLFKPY